MTKTADRRAVQVIDRGRYYTTNDLGQKRSTTPEGFLVCHDVPIARTGTQLYTAAEAPIDPGPDGLVRISREPDEVFRPDTLSSFEGKPVTVNHPDGFVTPENWKHLTVGFVQNVRRGVGIEDDLMVADLVITDQDGIEYVNRDLPEVSAGYEAEYEQLEPGKGRQLNIVGNHVALVERGRAGPRCSIQDGVPDMSKKRSFWDRLLTAVKAKDAEAVKAEIEDMDEAEEESEEEKAKKAKTGDAAVMAEVLSTLKTLTADVASLKKARAKDAEGDEEEEDEDDKKKTDDEVLNAETAETNGEANGKVLSGDSLKSIIARAEILAPGIQVPTGDSVGSDIAEGLMRRALETAMTTDAGKVCVQPFLTGREVKTLTGDALHSVFTGASELTRIANNSRGSRSAAATKDFGGATSAAAINERNRAFWAR